MMKIAILFSTCLVTLLPSVGSAQPRSEVVRAALQYVLRADINKCKTQDCGPVYILAAESDSALVPIDLGVVYLAAGSAAADSLPESTIVLALQEIDVSEGCAKVRILSMSTSPSICFYCSVYFHFRLEYVLVVD